MTAYYNEIDPYAADWLRNLIAAGRIAPGEVDTRSIKEVRPDDLTGFTQCHFFAGIGVWSYALRLAQWPDDQPVWTGSCPCQPFSAAGKGRGVSDDRHLWPEWFRLIRECRPAAVFGEQVASKPGLAWLDLVQADLEASGYAVGAADLCAAGVGAPHIRQRLWVHAQRLADNGVERLEVGECDGRFQRKTVRPPEGEVAVGGIDAVGLADAERHGLDWGGHSGPRGRDESADGGAIGGLGDAGQQPRERGTRSVSAAEAERAVQGRPNGRLGNRHPDAGEAGGVAQSDRDGPAQGQPAAEAARHRGTPVSDGGDSGTGPTHGFWADPDWLFCRDRKWRPVSAGTFPLAHGATQRVGRLRAYGNAIVAEVAAEFVRACK